MDFLTTRIHAHARAGWLWPLRALCGVALVACLHACTTDTYEEGDARYSYLRADFGMLHASVPGMADFFVVDRGDTVRLANAVAIDWVLRADTLYRALVYYDARNATLFKASRVLVAKPFTTLRPDTVGSDFIRVESSWTGGGFFNVGFAVKTGQSTAQAGAQTVGLMIDSTVRRPDSPCTDVYLRLVHRQNGQPEYYTVHGYVSTAVQPECIYHIDQ